MAALLFGCIKRVLVLKVRTQRGASRAFVSVPIAIDRVLPLAFPQVIFFRVVVLSHQRHGANYFLSEWSIFLCGTWFLSPRFR